MSVGILIALLPFGVVAFVCCLYSIYGEKFFSLDWPGHNLNDPEDPRILRLGLQTRESPGAATDDNRGQPTRMP